MQEIAKFIEREYPGAESIVMTCDTVVSIVLKIAPLTAGELDDSTTDADHVKCALN
jgi:hypothetical protein